VIDGLTYAIGGDVIVSIDGDPVTKTTDLQDAITRRKPGDTVTLGVVRADGSKADVQVTLGELPEGADAAQLLQP
jgi:S1-C subfamily serine protease